ncbi:MAG TPA: glycosyltransferase family 2 protein [Vicinamibacterales bacterium]|jgi:hypothetical protein
MTFLFWSSVGFVFYAYFGYPALLFVLARSLGRPVRRAPMTPSVSFIVAARNEVSRIRAKIENTLGLDYPTELLEIIIASDASDDGTNEIVREYEPRGVRTVVSLERKGKEFAQFQAIRSARGEILVFSDAATQLEPEGVRRIVQNFADPGVGCASSVDRVIDADGLPSGEGAYVRYEMFLRSLESRIGSVVGLSGSFFAARREVCDPWPVDLPSDFNTLLNTIKRGLRGVSDATAVGIYRDLSSPAAEYQRKVRTVTRGLRSLQRNLQLLNPLHHGLAAWQVLSHKLCRWLVPFALIGALVSSVILAPGSSLFAAFAAAQIFCYAASAYVISTSARVTGLWKVLPFFVLVNLSILGAWIDLLRGRRAVTWQPSRRN